MSETVIELSTLQRDNVPNLNPNSSQFNGTKCLPSAAGTFEEGIACTAAHGDASQ